ncbi:MAG: putative rane protein [Bryobacterales bacterium]|nr:putative rane protein [Bryobacterales bacterium]
MDRTLAVGLSVLVVTTLILLALRHPRVNALFRATIPAHPKRRQFLAAVSFFFTFAIARSLAYSNSHHIGPFHDIYIKGRHIHHLVWGILLLLVVGYGWLVGIGSGAKDSSTLAVRTMALLYGAGAALTLDEFALWLNLEDVYWAREGRESVDAVILFGALLLLGTWGRAFFLAVGRELLVLRKNSK